MPKLLADTLNVTTDVTTGTFYGWNNPPMLVALFFGFAGTVFVAIYFLRRWKK